MTALPFKRSRADFIFDIINYVLATILLIAVIYPLAYIVSASFSNPDYVNNGKMWLFPMGLNLEGYRRLLGYSEIWLGYRNTILYTTVGTMLNLCVTLPCAYAMSRKDFIGRNIVTTIIMITMFFQGGMIPTYIIMNQLGLLDTRLIMFITGATAAYNLFVSRTFFASTIPYELHEAAVLDGCTNFQIFVRVILPLSKPIIAVMALFFGVNRWNNYFHAMIYLSDRRLFPLQLFLREILVKNQVAVEMLATGDAFEMVAEQARIAEMIKFGVIIISTAPIIAVYPFVQRFFIKGVMLGAVKG